MDELTGLGPTLASKKSRYMSDRKAIEIQWLKNLRQYNRQYDPEVLEKIKPDRSRAYPGDTRVKCQGEVAKMMEMMFPAQERNWELSVSPVPSIPKDDLDRIIDQLEALEEARSLQEQRPPQSIRSDEIERAVKAFANERKEAMEEEIADQLADPMTDYMQMMKRALRSGTIYGIGIVRSPQVHTMSLREWEQNDETGEWEAKSKTVRRPYPEFVRCWDYYPDLSARIWEDQEGGFERVILNRNDFKKLADRPGFDKEAVNKYLQQNSTGNYTPQTFESELQKISDESNNLPDRGSRRYEVYRWLGFVSGHEMRDAGVDIKDDELQDMIFADVWIIDNTILKAKKAAFGEKVSDVYHAYIPAEDEDSGLTGVGLPEDMRDSQLSICAANRALMDNMAAVAGPIVEVNEDLLPSGRKAIGSIHAFMTIPREGEGQSAGARAVNAIFIPSHISEILAIIEMQRNQLNIESNLPPWTLGVNPQDLGEAFRTSSNMSSMKGGANMVTKDRVRAFDKLTVGVINSFYKWNMEFNPKQDIKGDFESRGKGNLSLVSKEVQGAALEQFVATMSPRDQVMYDMYGIHQDRLKARDLPLNRLLPRDEAMQKLEEFDQAQAAAAQVESALTEAKTNEANAKAEKLRVDAQSTERTTPVQIQEALSRAEQNLANAQTMEEKTRLERVKTILEGALKNGRPSEG